MTPEIILGPPGTGKTTRLLSLVEQELERGTAPERIAYVSFTRKAAEEAVERACRKFGISRRDMPYFRTLHSLCFHSLGLTRADVMEGKVITEFSDWLGLRMSEYRSMDDTTMFGFTEGDRAMFMENLSRVTMRPLRELYNENPDGLPWSLVERVQRGLAEFKKAKTVLDFTDMLQKFVDGGWSPPLEVVFVDEAQDLSALQWRVVWQLASRARRVVIAGDDDQAIYRWAGADVEQFVGLEGSVSVLDQSWRVTPEVQRLSSAILRKVLHRREKVWSPVDRPGQVERSGQLDTVDLSGEDILILGRNVFSLRQAADFLRREGVLFEMRGSSSVKPKTAAAVRTWEAIRRGESVPTDDAVGVYEFMSTGREVTRGHKKLPNLSDQETVSYDQLVQSGGLLTRAPWFEALSRISGDEVSYLRAALQRGEALASPRIRLSTIHGSKGGEADHVVLLPDMARRTHEEMLRLPEDEARVWYVAATRSRGRLTITQPRDRLHYDI